MSNQWAIKNLGDVCSFQGGSQPPKSNFIQEPREGYVRLLQIRDFTSDSKAVYIPEELVKKRCKKTDIMIARYGASVGQIHRGKEGTYNVALIKTNPNLDLIDIDFFYYYLQSPLFQKPLHKVSARAAQAGFSKTDIRDFQIPIPPLEEQKRIVSILDEAFENIEENKNQIVQKKNGAEELLQALLSSLMMPEKSGNKFREIRICDIIEPLTTINPSKQPDVEIEYIDVSSVNRDTLCIQKTSNLLGSKAPSRARRLVRTGDVIFATVRPTLQRIAIIPETLDGAVCSTGYYVLRPKNEVLSRYLFYYLLTPRFYQEMKSSLPVPC